MSEGDHSPGDIPASLVPILARMGARMDLLRDIVLFLCATTVPRGELIVYLERIQVPVDWGSRENLEIMEREIAALLGDLTARFGVTQP